MKILNSDLERDGLWQANSYYISSTSTTKPGYRYRETIRSLKKHYQSLAIYIYLGLVDRVFTNGLGDMGSIPDRIMPKTFKKWYLIPPCLTLSNIKYVSRVKWSNPGKGVAPFPTPQCSSDWKGSLLVTLDYSRQLYFYNTKVWIPFVSSTKHQPNMTIILVPLLKRLE